MMNRESLNRQKPQMTLKPVPTSGRFKVTSSVVITMNLEFNYLPKEETFHIPLIHIDVTWSTHIALDMLQEKRIGMSIRADICQILGKDSDNSLY